MPLIRYPGSKAKLIDQISLFIPDDLCGIFSAASRRPFYDVFFGSGAVGFDALESLSRRVPVRLSDLDVGIVSLWRAVRSQPSDLITEIKRFTPSVAHFETFKEEDGRDDLGDVRAGFRKLALHQMSYSGLGFKAGGPLGGKDQSSEYAIDCRWNPAGLVREVVRLHHLMAQFVDLSIMRRSVFDVLGTVPANAFVYLDPPYVAKGPELYRHPFDAADHERLAAVLLASSFEWLLSYDDHPDVRRLYKNCRFVEVRTCYTGARAEKNGTRPKNREVLILRG